MESALIGLFLLANCKLSTSLNNSQADMLGLYPHRAIKYLNRSLYRCFDKEFTKKSADVGEKPPALMLDAPWPSVSIINICSESHNCTSLSIFAIAPGLKYSSEG